MKRAYSIKLGCLVDARDCDYDDCREYEIVCEICRHRVYKAKRQGSLDEVHYLSHYAAQSAQARECELRVAAAIERDSDDEDSAGIGRGQSLAKRIAVLRLVLQRMLGGGGGVGDRLLKGERGTDLYRRLRQDAIGVFHRALDDPADAERDLRQLADEFANHVVPTATKMAVVPEMQMRRLTRLGQRTQLRWAVDMVRTLVLQESEKALVALADGAWAFLTMTAYGDVAQGRYPAFVGAALRTLAYDEPSARAFAGMADKTIMEAESDFIAEFDFPHHDMTMHGALVLTVADAMRKLIYMIDYEAKLPQPPPVAPKRKPRPKRTHRRK